VVQKSFLKTLYEAINKNGRFDYLPDATILQERRSKQGLILIQNSLLWLQNAVSAIFEVK
jgi:hypothetical protein